MSSGQGSKFGSTRRTLMTGLAATPFAPFITRARAETSEINIAKQFGLAYLQQDIIEHEKLIEKHAAKLGLPNLKANFVRLVGTGAVTDALLAGSLHIASGGPPGAMLLWDRTRGAIRICFATSASNQKLLTVRPDLRTVKDLQPTDRIALPAVKTSPQAIFLQMAAIKAFGPSEWSRFDSLTVTRAHPDSMAQMLAKSEIDCHWSSTPFQERELANPAVHEVANALDVIGLPSVTPAVAYASASFRDANPLAWRALVAAFAEATEFANRQPQQAAEIYLANSGDKDTVGNVLASMRAPGSDVTLQPRGVQKMADHMATTGLLKRRPDKLADLLFPEAAELGAS